VRARAVVSGTVAQPAKIDVHGWAASLSVDIVLAGEVRVGDTLRIAWEELSTGRRERFADGDRIIAVLDPLPSQSLWRKRFPPTDGKQTVLVVAANGEAFLRDPDGPTVDVLEHYFAMTGQARDGAPGSVKLAQAVAVALPTVAREALALLEERPQPRELLGQDGAEFLLGAARSTARPSDIRSGALVFAAKVALPGTREAALALAQPGSPLRSDAYRALGVLGALSPAEIEKLLADPDPGTRSVATELAADPGLRPQLVKLAHADPSPDVRIAAGRALLARYGGAAIHETIDLLDDSDASVRTRTAESIGGLGKDAVEPLRAVAEKGSEPAALAAVYGLSRAGKEGGDALYFIANSHPNEKVRVFAGLAIGKPAPKED
jgi:hypothetical protein